MEEADIVGLSLFAYSSSVASIERSLGLECT
jgi:hypothetical protein